VRTALFALVLLVAVAACSSDPSTISGTASTSTTASGGATSLAPGNGTATTSAAGTATGAGGARPTSTSTSVRPRPEALGDPGANAALYLRASPARSLHVQLLVEGGAAPRQATLDHLLGVLRDVSGKPVSVVGGSLPSTSSDWTDASITGAAAARAPSPASDVALLQILFVKGSYEGDRGVLGITVNAGVAAIFSDSVSAAATGLVTAARVEEAVSTHELGHLLGLVDLYLHTGRADAAHPGHSTNPRSVMYWAVESDLVGDLLSGGPPIDFDSTDLRDLATIRNG
jgi:hypothetical protein